MARWASETSLSSLVSDNSSQKQLKNLRLQDEQNNELKAFINLKSKQTFLAFCPPISILAAILDDFHAAYWASNILVGATEN